ncbi:MAG: hypothetical protein DRJ49_06870 [Thermoprotei archaeon]|nr:MAG: hypothetical protein DRJ49_06870 [Thermoprotei archaeon]
MVLESQEELSYAKKREVLLILNEYGRRGWNFRWKEHMAISNELLAREYESIIRYLLLRAIINQQAESLKARELTINLYKEFKEKLLRRPWEIELVDYIKVFRRIGGHKGSAIYRVGFLRGIKPISLFTYRIMAYVYYIKKLEKNKESLRGIIEESLNVKELYDLLRNDEILSIGWVGKDPKACRMFINWIIFLYNKVWKESIGLSMRDTLMIVDGHVGKVFARTGLIGRVRYEKVRPYIIEAAKMRYEIEQLVHEFPEVVPFYVDNGAFYLFEDGYCLEESPRCDSCPLSRHCKKYIKWTGYKIYREE